MLQESDIRKLAEEHLAGSEHFLVDIKIKTGNKILVFIDGDSGVTIEDCIGLSRYIEQSLDRDREDFELNVSSSGLDKPLKLKRQYDRHAGKKVTILTTDGMKRSGILLNTTEEGIHFREQEKTKKKNEPENAPEFIAFNEIKETKLIISFKDN